MTGARRLGVHVLATASAVGLALAAATMPAVAESEVEFRIRDERITESSGLTRDVANDRYWTVNDSGDAGIAYALDENGRTEGTVRFRAEPQDIEAAAMHEGRLYLADIGDNGRDRDFVTVFFFDDPQPDDQTVTYRAYDFAYPDGAHDAETLLVDGDGRLFIVTKEEDAGIYAAPVEPSRQGVNDLERVADAPAFVTDGTYLPEGNQIALRTYVTVEVLDTASQETVARVPAPIQPQGETITVSLDGDALLLGSEGERSAVHRIGIPTEVDSVPSPESTPPSTESATPAPTPSPLPSEDQPTEEPDGADEADQETAAPGRRGTLMAVGLAGVVAVVAGVVVAIIRRP